MLQQNFYTDSSCSQHVHMVLKQVLPFQIKIAYGVQKLSQRASLIHSFAVVAEIAVRSGPWPHFIMA